MARELVARWWNGTWGRLTRRDVWLAREVRWHVVARAGDSETGRVLRWEFDTEDQARQMVQRLVQAGGQWREQTGDALSNVVQEYTAANGPRMSLFPQSHDWSKARTDAGMETDSHEDMHAGELETSLLLHVAPELIRVGNEAADWTADDRPHLLTLGMAAYTTSGVIGRPSLGTVDKGKAALDSLTQSFAHHQRALGL